MTKFIDGSKRNEPKKEVKKTVFTHSVNSKKEIIEARTQPEDCDNIEFLFHNKVYGDIFKTWNNINSNNITLFFGTKGDEYYE